MSLWSTERSRFFKSQDYWEQFRVQRTEVTCCHLGFSESHHFLLVWKFTNSTIIIIMIMIKYQRTKKAVEYEGDSDTNCNWCTWNGSQRLGKGPGKVGNQRMITALLRPAGILRRILETCCHKDSSERPSVNAGVKDLPGVYYYYYYYNCYYK